MDTIVLFGAAGNLAQRKLYEGWSLLHTKDRAVRLIGIDKKEWSQSEFLEFVRASIPNLDGKKWKSIQSHIHYLPLKEAEKKGFSALQKILGAHSEGDGRVFYFATPTNVIPRLVESLAESRIIQKGNPREQIVVEKPFGLDGEDSKKLYAHINAHVSPEQVVSVDHYLAKPVLHHFMEMRRRWFTDSHSWGNRSIDHIQICLLENNGVEGRASYFDHTGLVKDMLQNHVLLTMCMIAGNDSSERESESRMDILRSIKKIHPKEVIAGQYTGYTLSEGVDPYSKTETFVAAKLRIENDQWRNVPFYIKTGKSLQHTWAGIFIKFKDHSKFDYVVVQMKPRELIQVGYPNGKREVFHENKAPSYGENYAVILQAIFEGKKDIFVSQGEISHLWRVVEDLRMPLPGIHKYEVHSKGPSKADELIWKDKRRWVDEVLYQNDLEFY